jgi:WD40 repeat protein
MVPRWKSGKLIPADHDLTLACCSNGVSAIAWSPDGKRLAAAGVDFRIYVWDAESGKRQAVLEGHSAFISSLAFNHAGTVLASSGWDDLTCLWNSDTGRRIASHPWGQLGGTIQPG